MVAVMAAATAGAPAVLLTVASKLFQWPDLPQPKSWRSQKTQCFFCASMLFHLSSRYLECLFLLLLCPSPPQKRLLVRIHLSEEGSTPMWSRLHLSQEDFGSVRPPLLLPQTNMPPVMSLHRDCPPLWTKQWRHPAPAPALNIARRLRMQSVLSNH